VPGDRNCSADCFLWEKGALSRLGPDGPAGMVTAYWGGFGPDGKPLVLGYGSERKPTVGSGLWIGPIHDAKGTIITENGSLAQDSSAGVFYRRVGRHYQLFRGDKALTAGEVDSLEPSASRDDQCLAFNRGGRIQLWHDGRHYDLGPGYNPCVSADGRWLAFARDQQVVWRKIRE